MRIIASSALLFLFAVSALASQEEASPAAARPLISDEGAGYAKVILPVKAPAGSDHPAVESWIARKLRKQGATVFTAATGWVRLPEKGEDITAIWDAILNGAPHGCPVYGQVGERTDDDRVSVTLSGWAPFH